MALIPSRLVVVAKPSPGGGVSAVWAAYPSTPTRPEIGSLWDGGTTRESASLPNLRAPDPRPRQVSSDAPVNRPLFTSACQHCNRVERAWRGRVHPVGNSCARGGFRGCGHQSAVPAVKIDNRNVGDKPVATFWKSLDIAWILCGISQHTAELADRNVDGLVKVAKTLVGPEPVA